jgi:hypothetical protein
VTTYTNVTEEKVEKYQVSVPYTVQEQVEVTVCKMVAQTVTVPVWSNGSAVYGGSAAGGSAAGGASADGCGGSAASNGNGCGGCGNAAPAASPCGCN